MITEGFAGSNGLMDVPAPDWLVQNECLFAHWGSFLLAMIKHGSIETIHKTEPLELATLEFGLLIDGGLYVTDSAGDDDPRTLLIQMLKRGDLFTAAIGRPQKFKLAPHCKTTCLIIRERAFEPFRTEFPSWNSIFPLVSAWMALAYSRALSDSLGRDQDRIKRVLTMLASHPTAVDSKLGREVKANKHQIRDLAGVQKRSATRAFRALEESGAVSFYGYKRLFYREYEV